ncbi:MAG TPA: hypothetical protein EYQ25_04930 [Planctomycetes bacterium]|nr:hypothetical protein [Planctomycetota bacterium]HIL36098.1 hypothetical protein [Planctomycetota bacterium]
MHAINLCCSLLCGLALVSSPLHAVPARGGGPSGPVSSSSCKPEDYAARAQRALERIGLPPDEALGLETLLAAGWVRLPAGGVDLYLSARSLQDEDTRELFLSVAEGVLAAQDVLLGWCPMDPKLAKPLHKQIAALRGAYKKPKGTPLRRALGQGKPGEAFELLGLKDSLWEDANSLGEVLSQGLPLGLELEPKPLVVILVPDREEFVDMLALAGRVDPTAQPYIWLDEAASWSHFFIQEARVYSLVHVDGTSMDKEDRPNLTRQQISQLVLSSLFEHWSDGHLPMALIAGLALEVIVEAEGECDTRLDGDLRGRATEAWEMFVPGGLSEGGILPAMPAFTRWREFAGRDHFVVTLRIAQSDGADDMKRQGGGDQHFRLYADDEVHSMTLSGPFLGSAAVGRDIPDRFRGDWLEFLRAYRSGFLYWLRTEAGSSKRKSGEQFRHLLEGLIRASSPEVQEAVWPTIYGGAALSTRDLERGCLEQRFLSWLRRQR